MDSNPSDLAEIIRQMFVAEPRERRIFPERPKEGLTIGTSLPLLANHFLLRIGQKKAYHYDIEIERAVKQNITDTNVVDRNVEESNSVDRNKNKFSRKLATKLNRKVFKQMVEFYSNNDNRVFSGINPVYDGQKNMFTSRILNGTENGSLRLKIQLTDEGRDSTFYVNIQLTETNYLINLNILSLYHRGQTCDDEMLKKSVLFINTLLRHNSSMSWIPIGQSIYDPNGLGQKLGPYLTLNFGYYSSVRNLMVGPTLNIDRSASAFYDSSLGLKKIMDSIINGNLSQIPRLDDSKRRKIIKELSGLQVEALHIQYGNTHRKYRIIGMTRESAKDIVFDWKVLDSQQNTSTTTKISINDYFEKKYNITLKFPNLPCFEVGNPSNVVKLPLEICRLVPHQRLTRLMTNKEKSDMTRISGQQKPRERLLMCQKYVINQFHEEGMARENRPFLSEFEINVSKDLLKVDSMVIPPPALNYGPNLSVTPKDGEWEMHKSRVGFLKPQTLEDNWILIDMSFTDSIKLEDIKELAKGLCDQAIEMGMTATIPTKIPRYKEFVSKTTFDNIKKNIKTLSGLKMILFITPNKTHEYSEEIYRQIKLLGDVEEAFSGLTTQCMNINSIWNTKTNSRKWSKSYLRQLMLKVNPKLGGTNVALLKDSSMPSIFKEKSLMIIGADVNHPAPADKISPSIAALVGSYDNEYSNYYTTVSMQPKTREEMIKNLDIMAVELLTHYNNKNGCLPLQIIFYRDGVSEGQFQHVIDNEYPLLTKAFTKMNPKYKPKLTFIVVQKRHHTRFMTADKMQNVPPGTVVERDITHKRDFDFYLCSHAGRIGTSRSAHYYVLADENEFSSNDMCKMTYYLCHIYQRCTKSVSIPAPVYYADLAAYRAKVHASPQRSGSVNSGNSGDESQIIDNKDMIKVTDAQKERLYFC